MSFSVHTNAKIEVANRHAQNLLTGSFSLELMLLYQAIAIYSTISTRIELVIILVKVLDFVATVSHQGRMRVIVVPRRLHFKLDKIEDKQVRVIVEDILG